MKKELITGKFKISPSGTIWTNVVFGIDGIWNEHFLGSISDKKFKDIGSDGLVTVVNFELFKAEIKPYFSVGKVTLFYEATTRQHVSNALHKKQSELRYAYFERIKAKKDIKGSITLNLGIDNNGMVVYSKIIESTLNDTIFENDVIRISKKWYFEELKRESKDTIDFTCPYMFSH